MRCHVCNVAVGDGQRFCHSCGEDLHRVTTPTEPFDVIGSNAAEGDAAVEAAAEVETAEVEPSSAQVAAPSIAEPALDASIDPNDGGWWSDSVPAAELGTPALLTPTAEIDPAPAPGYEPTLTMPAVGDGFAGAGVGGFGGGLVGGQTITDEIPTYGAHGAIFDGVADVAEYTVPPSAGFGLRTSFVLALLAIVTTLMAAVADVIDIRTSRPVDGIVVGIRVLDDFGTNLAVGAYIGAAVMLVGGLLSCFGLRWGAGLAGGGGLALAGWSVMTIGLVEVPIHGAEGITLNAPTDVNGFTLAVTRDLGWFLILAVGVLGLLVFMASLRMASAGARRGLNPWLAAVGALGALILAAGPLVPLGDATLDLNLGFVGLPRLFFAGRIVQLGLIALAGVIGFLSVRTYGLGLAAGGVSVATWLWATSLGEFGDRPVSVAVGNLGTLDTTPHAVTSVGVAVTIVMLASAATYATLTRES